MSSKEYSTHEETEDISDIEDNEINDNESQQITDEAKENYITDEFREKVKAYVVIDDAIRRKQDEIKELKTKKKPCEDYILRFLQKSQNNYIDIGAGKLIKNESETKAPLKIDIIKEAISEKTKNEKIFDSDEKYNKFIESIMDLMDKKRPMQKRINLKRTFQKQVANKNINKKNKKG